MKKGLAIRQLKEDSRGKGSFLFVFFSAGKGGFFFVFWFWLVSGRQKKRFKRRFGRPYGKKKKTEKSKESFSSFFRVLLR